MKKFLLLISFCYCLISAYAQNPIPNGNFENWNSLIFENPAYYNFTSNKDSYFRFGNPPNVVKTSDSYHSNSAVKLTTKVTPRGINFAYFVNTNPNNGDPMSWKGGLPYNQKPTGISGYYKYNVATADSAVIIIVFNKDQTNIGTYAFKLGGINNTYAGFKFTFDPPLSQTPDSVIFAASSSNILNGEFGLDGSTLFLDSVSFNGVANQPANFNGDFEAWDSQTFYSPENWFLESDKSAIARSSDAHSGQYAIELKTILETHDNNPISRPGQIGTGYYPENCGSNCQQRGGYPYDKQKDTLTFWYKYAPANTNDSAIVYYSFKKNGNMVGGGMRILKASANYKYIEEPFYNFQQPDSVMIQIMSSSWNDTLVSFAGASLKIDDIYFKSQLPAGISNFKPSIGLSVFPNPAKDVIYIRGLQNTLQDFSAYIYNLQGQIVLISSNVNAQKNVIDISHLSEGVYFLSLQSSSQTIRSKIVIGN